MSSLSELIIEFRKSLHDDIDRALDNATRRLLFGMIDQTVNDTQVGMRAVQYAIDTLTERVGELQRAHEQNQFQGMNASTIIPEIYHTGASLSDVVASSTSPTSPMEVETETEEEMETETDVEVVEVVDDETVEDVEEEVVDDETVEEEEEEAEAVEEEEEEEEAEGLKELEVDGTTYYYDAEGNVYQLDSEGEATGPVGRYNEEAGEFELFEEEAAEPEAEPEEEALEEFTHKGKTYYKDSENNVYNAEGEALPYSYVNGRFAKNPPVSQGAVVDVEKRLVAVDVEKRLAEQQKGVMNNLLKLEKEREQQIRNMRSKTSA